MSDPISNGQITDVRTNAGRFAPGGKGGPGRPPGSRNASTLMAEQLMEGALDDIVKSVIEKAKAGDLNAAKLVLDKILPARRGRPLHLTLPAIEGPADVTRAFAALFGALADGSLSAEEAAALGQFLTGAVNAVSAEKSHARLREIVNLPLVQKALQAKGRKPR